MTKRYLNTPTHPTWLKQFIAGPLSRTYNVIENIIPKRYLNTPTHPTWLNEFTAGPLFESE